MNWGLLNTQSGAKVKGTNGIVECLRVGNGKTSWKR
jgi:hypothetical protein